eukprot:1387950-Pyramimonas_sp.AAC.1
MTSSTIPATKALRRTMSQSNLGGQHVLAFARALVHAKAGKSSIKQTSQRRSSLAGLRGSPSAT